MRNEALNETKFFDAGDGQYADDVGGSTGNAMETFIKNMGDHSANNREADFLHVSSHGAANGNLYDDSSDLIFDPDSGTHGIVNNTDWNNDADWIVLAACSTLNTNGGGRDAWVKALSGSERRVHGILGAWKPIGGDLRDVWEGFWDRMQAGSLIRAAYVMAMEFDGSEAQPWAMIYYDDNRFDTLKEMTRDVAAGNVSIEYLDVNVLNPRQVPDVPQHKGYGKARVLCQIADEQLARKFPSVVSMEPDLSVTNKVLPFANVSKLRRDGTVEFGEFLDDREGCSCSTEQVQAWVTEFIEAQFPEIKNETIIRQIAPIRILNPVDRREQITGYLVVADLCFDGIPVLGDTLRIRIQGNSIRHLTIHRHKPVERKAQAVSVSVKNPTRAIADVAPQLVATLRIKGVYDIDECMLCYAYPDHLGTRRSAILGPSADFVPVWRFIVRWREGENRERSSLVFVHAETGKYLGAISSNLRSPMAKTGTGKYLPFPLAMATRGISKRDWRHSQHTVWRGTRSEGKVWLLCYGDSMLLPQIPEVRIAGRRYVYVYRDVPFQKHGGWTDETQQGIQKIEMLSDELTSDEAARGWYICRAGTMKRATPEEWIWVPLHNLWISPNRVNDPTVYAKDGWKYVVEVTERDHWELQGRLYFNGVEQQQNSSVVKTPIGSFQWMKFNGCEWGWVRTSVSP